MLKKRFLPSTLITILGIAGASLLGAGSAQASSTAIGPNAMICQAKGYELCDPESTTVVVDKLRQLNPQNYRPAVLIPTTAMPLSAQTTPGSEDTQVRPVVSAMLDLMYFEAKLDGVNLTFRSGFRSEKTQATVYAQFLADGGQEYADRYVARPGYSEHQTGLTADINIGIPGGDPNANAQTAAGYKWIANNADRFGFVVRYQEGNKPVTGFSPEPWHLRYVGKKLAPAVAKIPLETYFGLPPAPDYAPVPVAS